MKILILITMYQRHGLTDAILRNLFVIRRHLRGKIDIKVLVAGSEGNSSLNLVKKYGFLYTEQPNSPLGRKWNNALKISQRFDYTHLVILGSDDLINEETFHIYHKHQDYGIVSFNDLFIHSLGDGKTKYLNGYTDEGKKVIGAGFMIRRDIIEKAQFNLWANYLNKGLDGSMMKHLDMIPNVITRQMIGSADGAFLIDVKTDVNIHSYTQIGGIPVTSNPLKYFDDSVLTILNSIS